MEQEGGEVICVDVGAGMPGGFKVPAVVGIATPET